MFDRVKMSNVSFNRCLLSVRLSLQGRRLIRKMAKIVFALEWNLKASLLMKRLIEMELYVEEYFDESFEF